NFWFDRGFTWLVYLFAGITVAILFVMTWVIFQQAQPAIGQFGLGFLWSQDWDTGNQIFGALPYIYGTLVSSAIAILLAVPVGISIALVTSEDFLPIPVKSTLAFVVELIAAIPSVIIGLWGIFVFIPVIKPLEKWLGGTFAFIPLFNTEDPVGNNMLTAGIILSIMILPTMAAISRDVLLVIPKELRSSSMALGGTRWETIFRVLLPAGFSGLVSAAMLSLGRALGETMAVTMVIGNYAQISLSLLDPAYTIPAVLANEFAEAEPGLHIGSLSYLGLILFALTLAVNIAAVLLVKWVGKKHR
ncbi:MAG: phosphate ABC transporter permease subunit PstC, partial [Dolichospermum sp.]